MGFVVNTSSVEPGRRLEYWCDMISSTFVALDCEAPHRDDFSGAIVSSALQDVQFSRVTSDAQHVSRSYRRIRQAGEEYFLVSLQAAGRGEVTQGERTARLALGDFALYDTTKPYELRFTDHFEQIVLRIPREHLCRRIVNPERLTAITFAGAHGATAVVSQFIRNLHAQMDTLEPHARTAMHAGLVDLLAASLAGAIAGSSSLPTPTCLMMRQRIRDYVEAHLQDPDLNCEKIAAAHRISVRYLHKLFVDAEHPIAEWIWLRRLEKARQAIECSSVTGQSITQIAYTWGFGDPAHFSRAFKAKFGVSPSALRGAPPSSGR
jgi:AraC-like DNA-binding protein